MAGTSYMKKALLVAFKCLVALLYISPFYIVLIYAVKSKPELAQDRLGFPTTIHWENFVNGVKQSNFFNALWNSLLSTVISVVVLTLICSMAAYIIARRKNKLYSILYYLMLGAMLIPFQAIMTPLYKDLKAWGLIDTILGFSLAKIGFEVAYTTILITGFVKSIPVDLEEAAVIDGTSPWGTFWKIVFPLMKPIVCTSAILNTLSVWNDFQVSVVILQKMEKYTLSLTQYFFFGKNVVELGMAFAVFLLSMIPIIALYLALQRYIISGITSGAVKG
ncbi:carbohydrate ABC transporter permease [Youxingia wuxianensis]|uniref:Carbohydrate ABC transporter permease n=1 Tax=Youxingia wuxianensis TaxID=2763678 RepID=A0A926EPL6_9FIRM|nr:carbohydrate ABC transporter permease [Youxingia wuxianensis]MBC8585092.1 carbohydrate ABC transporter permease [Youxingia wuxianensis]